MVRHTRTCIAVVFVVAFCTKMSVAQPAEAPSAAPREVAIEPAPTAPLPPNMKPIFDGKTLEGWVQEPINATNFGGGDITDPDALMQKLSSKTDPVSAFVGEKFDNEAKATIAAAPTTQKTRAQRSALAKVLTAIANGPAIYDEARFKGVTLRDETKQLLAKKPEGRELARLNHVLLEDAYPNELSPSAAVAWVAKNGIIASLGAGRGVIYTKQSFDRYRVIFDMKHVYGKPDHAAAVLIFCTAPADGEKPLDALGGIQFQVPNGGTWDYRKGKNNGGKGLFTKIPHDKIDQSKWSRCEILIDPKSGTARMAVAQPPGAKAVEVLNFKDETAGQKGPFALQMHNKGLFDEFANIVVEENPSSDELVTTK